MRILKKNSRNSKNRNLRKGLRKKKLLIWEKILKFVQASEEYLPKIIMDFLLKLLMYLFFR